MIKQYIVCDLIYIGVKWKHNSKFVKQIRKCIFCLFNTYRNHYCYIFSQKSI